LLSLPINNQTTQPIKKEKFIEQVGVIRTSCYDCLDRTNKIQMRIAWKVLQTQMNMIGINSKQLFGDNFNYVFEEEITANKIFDDIQTDVNKYQNFDNKYYNKTEYDQMLLFTCGKNIKSDQSLNYPEFDTNNENDKFNKNILNNLCIDDQNLNSKKLNDKFVPHKFLKSFKNIWKENGEKISLQYTGAKDINKFKNVKNTGNEFFNSNERTFSYKDSLKQRCIDILLKKYHISLNKSKYTT